MLLFFIVEMTTTFSRNFSIQPALRLLVSHIYSNHNSRITNNNLSPQLQHCSYHIWHFFVDLRTLLTSLDLIKQNIFFHFLQVHPETTHGFLASNSHPSPAFLNPVLLTGHHVEASLLGSDKLSNDVITALSLGETLYNRDDTNLCKDGTF